MRLALRPYIITGAAIAGASIFVVAPTSPRLPDVQVPAVQPAGSELNDVNMQDYLGLLTNPDAAAPAPEVVPGPDAEVPDSVGGSPDLGGLLNPNIAPPDLGPLDLNGFDLGGVPGPGNLPDFVSSPAPPPQ
jgi:hypothetical protein